MQLISGKAIRHKNKIDTFMKMDLKINHGKGWYVLQYCKRAFLSTNLGRHTDVKVLFKYNQNTRDILLLIWLSNEPRYTYL